MGQISANALIILVREKHWYSKELDFERAQTLNGFNSVLNRLDSVRETSPSKPMLGVEKTSSVSTYVDEKMVR